ncbi:MAG: 30S ribosomal protein S12 methylthiotransferase RimO [Treponema sp.]|nr:30S ribosomal protein S12 methylthiotransferase RimO [Treponema sp.]
MRYFLDPFGCAKNQVDAENMMASLNGAGFISEESAEEADLIIVNSCGFIESAKKESIDAVLAWHKLFPGKKILLAGCLAQRYKEELSVELPEADAIFGIDDLPGIVEAVTALAAGRGRRGPDSGVARSGDRREVRRGERCEAALRGGPDPGAGARPLLSLPGSAYVKISDGCDNNCSYCAIPLIRGRFKSRPIESLVEECKTLLERGIKELCLIGQDLGSYGRDFPGSGKSLPALMQALSGLNGDFWVRLLYIHPDHFPLSILDIMEGDRRFLPYFDIPFQHSSEKILKAMNRSGTAENYLGLIEKIRGRLSDAVIRSTFLTGFPGETEEDFALLLDFQRKASLDWMGCFTYSREEGTPAYDMKGRVTKKTAALRKSLLEEMQIPITEKQIDRLVGRSSEVIVEERFEPAFDSDESALYLGRLPCQAPEVDGTAIILTEKTLTLGAKLPCKVIARRGFDLEVTIV